MMMGVCITLLVYTMLLVLAAIAKHICSEVILPVLVHVVASFQSMFSFKDISNPDARLNLFFVMAVTLAGIFGLMTIIMFFFWAKKYIFESKSDRLSLATLLLLDGYLLCAANFLLDNVDRMGEMPRVVVGTLFGVLLLANYLLAKIKLVEIK